MRLAIADDSSLFRDGLAMLLATAGQEVVCQCPNGEDLLTEVEHEAPDVVILDIRMPPTFTEEGLATARKLRDRYPATGILVLSTYAETAYAVQVLDIAEHSMGYLLKDRVSDTSTLLEALDRISRGETVIDPDIVHRLIGRQRTTRSLDRLTDRERQVLTLMAEGRSNAGIARELCLHIKTIEHYIAAVFSQLGLEESMDDNRRVLAVLSLLRSNL